MNIYEGIFKNYEEALLNIKVTNSFDSKLYEKNQKKIIRDIISFLDNDVQIPPFYKQHTQYLVYLISILNNSKNLKILDYGGGWGVGYANILESLESNIIKKIDYTIYDLKNICSIGETYFKKHSYPYKKIEYVSNELELKKNKYDIIFLGSSLQYTNDYKKTLNLIQSLKAKYVLMVDIYAGEIPTFCTLQKYFDYKMPHWFLNIKEIQYIFKKDYKILNKSYAHTLRLNRLGILEMSNFKNKYRLKNSVNLLYKKNK